MLKKSITYEDYNGDTQTEDFYFNLTKAELVELEMSHTGGLKESLERIVAAQDGKQIIKEMKEIVLGAYGVKSPDGKRFIKNQQLREEFESSEAYSVFFMELVTQVDAAVDFVKGIMPKGLADDNQIEMEMKKAADPAAPNLPDVRYPDGVEIRAGEPRKLTQEEVVEMDNDELKSGLATGRYAI